MLVLLVLSESLPPNADVVVASTEDSDGSKGVNGSPGFPFLLPNDFALLAHLHSLLLGQLGIIATLLPVLLLEHLRLDVVIDVVHVEAVLLFLAEVS